MAFVGNRNGPRKSEIVMALGADYFGITEEQLLKEIELYKDDEFNGVVDPVYEDAEGRRFLVFDAPGGRKIQIFHLEDHGYILSDNVEKRKYEVSIGFDIKTLISDAEKGIHEYLDAALESEGIDKQLHDGAKCNTLSNLTKWLEDPKIDVLSPNLKLGVIDAIQNKKWADLVNAFWKSMSFGTSGIRGLMANDRASIIALKEKGIDARILRGPNTLNNTVLLITSAGVARFGLDRGYSKLVIGYDSRIRGWDFAKIIAELFLYYGYTVYLFDAPCPYPEVTFAVPYKAIKANMGILISASHNDYRYNGYKLSCGNGSQFDPEERGDLYNRYIVKSETEDIRLCPLKDAPNEKLVFLGGNEIIEGFDYYGHELIDIHKAHREHVKSFLLFRDGSSKDPLKIAYCAFHGAGRIAVPRLLKEVGFEDVKVITSNGLNELDGLFPSFESEPGREQQPDPGDPRAARIAVEAFQEEYPREWGKMDILIGTDPDADRCGVVVKVPENQQFLYDFKDYMLMPADDMWALVVWFRLNFDKSINSRKTFVVLSHTTSDSIVKLALKHGLGVVKTWVGFGGLSAGVRDAWDKELIKGLHEGKENGTDEFCHPFIYETINMDDQRSYNLAAMEQSNGFSILGSPSPDEFSLGLNGHVRDKDGTFAALLVAEIAEWAKENGTSIFKLIDKHIYLDPDIGLFVNRYEPDPLDGEYPGIEGDRIKKAILTNSLGLYRSALAGTLEIGGKSVKLACIYRTGKYDRIYTPTPDFQFPDEGIRFYFDEERLNHLTIRPSGTTNSLRFHVQLHHAVDKNSLIQEKKRIHEAAKRIADHIRELVGAPRES